MPSRHAVLLASMLFAATFIAASGFATALPAGLAPEKLHAIEDQLSSEDLGAFVVKNLDPKDLPTEAKARFDEVNQSWAPDYPAEAQIAEVQGVRFILITESNDGGASMDLFTLKGEYIAGASAGESSPWRWDRP